MKIAYAQFYQNWLFTDYLVVQWLGICILSTSNVSLFSEYVAECYLAYNK